MSDNIPHTWKSSTDVQRRSVFARLDDLEAHAAALEASVAMLLKERENSIEHAIVFKAKYDANEARYKADRDAMEARHQQERERR